jgi:uncharacterized protein YheU (UPF0270 family)
MNDDPSGTAEREADADPVEVPHAALDPEKLRAVIESFVLREGTDYGEKELALDEKVARMMAQLKMGEASIVFDPDSDSVTILRGRAPAGAGKG